MHVHRFCPPYEYEFSSSLVVVLELAIFVRDRTQIQVLVVDLTIFVLDSTQIPVLVVDLAIFVWDSTQIICTCGGLGNICSG